MFLLRILDCSSEEDDLVDCNFNFTNMASGMENITDAQSATCWTQPDDNNIPDGRILMEIMVNKSCLPFPKKKFILRVRVRDREICTYIPIAYPYHGCDNCMHLCRVVNDRARLYNYCDLKCDCQAGHDKCLAYLMSKIVDNYLNICDIHLIG